MQRRAFTIVELLVVIAIIGLLAAASIIGLTTQQQIARDGRRATDMRTAADAIESYISSTNNMPASTTPVDGGWDMSSINPTTFMASVKNGGFLSQNIKDPINDANTNLHYAGMTGYTYEFASALNGTIDGAYKLTPTKALYVVEARTERTNAALANKPAGLTCTDPNCATLELNLIRYAGWQ